MRALTDFPDAHLRIFDRPQAPPPDAIRDVYLIGICGTGMGSLAGLFQEAGYHVQGSDEAVYPPMSTRLEGMGIRIHTGFDASNLEHTPDLVVIGNACTPDHVEAAFAREKGLTQQSFPEALAHFFIRKKRSLVVAGTHGKTTSTGMLLHIFKAAGRDPGYLVGGVMTSDGKSYSVGGGEHFIVEGDEYDSAYFDKQPKFMHYRPTSAIITSLEFDHADIYENIDDYRMAFQRFAGLIASDGALVLNGDDEAVRRLSAYSNAKPIFYGLTERSNHVTATDIRIVTGGQCFTLVAPGGMTSDVFLPMSGSHNLMNALAVCALALDEGLTREEISTGFASFKGLKRRQEIRAEIGDILVLDDFAHHPTAVRCTISAVKERWQERRVIAVFEPRSNTSRRKVFEEAYTTAFNDADVVFMSAPPLRHNDTTDNFMDIGRIADAIRQNGSTVQVHPNADAVLPCLLNETRPGDVVVVMSNGGFGGLMERLLAALEDQKG